MVRAFARDLTFELWMGDAAKIVANEYANRRRISRCAAVREADGGRTLSKDLGARGR